MLLDETVAPVELSKTDWARGEPKAEMNAKRVLRRSEIGERRKAAGNWMKQGQRWRYLVFFVFGFLIASVPFPLRSTEADDGEQARFDSLFRDPARAAVRVYVHPAAHVDGHEPPGVHHPPDIQLCREPHPRRSVRILGSIAPC